MIGALEVLTPSIILIALALLTVPILGIVRRHSKGHKPLSLVWVLTVFSALSIGIARLYFEYYAQAENEPFVTVFSVGGADAHLSIDRRLKEFSGIGRRLPMTSLALVVAVFSFSGIPPLSGFVAKYMVFTAAIEADMAWLAVVGVLNSLLQTAYLVRLVHYMYGRRTRQRTEGKEPRDLLVAVYALVALIVILGLYPSLALTIIYPAAQQLSLLVP